MADTGLKLPAAAPPAEVQGGKFQVAIGTADLSGTRWEFERIEFVVPILNQFAKPGAQGVSDILKRDLLSLGNTH